MKDIHAKAMLGDCLKRMNEIEDHSVDLILCDLPYGTTQNKWDTVIPFDKLWEQYRRICKGAIVLTAQPPFDKVLGASNISMLKYEWIWQKENGTGHLNAKKSPLKNHENVLVFYDNQPTYNPQMRFGFKPYKIGNGEVIKSTNYGKHVRAIVESKGERYPLTIIKFNRDPSKIHPTQKPVALMEYLIKTYTNEGDLVLDNCMGSGTTGVAAVNTNRSFIGIEQNPEYYKIAVNRIKEAKIKHDKEQKTGKLFSKK